MATKQEWQTYLELLKLYQKEVRKYIKGLPDGEVQTSSGGSNPPTPPPPPPGN